MVVTNLVFCITTLAKGIGSLLSWSYTFPEREAVCANRVSVV